MKTRKLTVMAMLTALSVVLVWLVHFPLFPAASYLEYDPADIPILIGTFAYGPLCGLVLTLVAAGIQALTVSAASGVYGFVMHVAATFALCLPAGILYQFRHTRGGATLGLACGTLCMAAVMMVANHFITPLFTGMPTAAVDALLLPITLPFNLLKAGINSVVTFFLYKPVSRYFIHGEKLPRRKSAAQQS